MRNVRTKYSMAVMEHFNNPKNIGSFDIKSENVGTGVVGAPACGDVMKLQIEVDPNTGKITKVAQKVFGCGSAIAASSLATEIIKNTTLEEALTVKNSYLASELKLPPVKLHCSMLAEDAIGAAIKDYKSKNSEPSVMFIKQKMKC